MTITLVEAILAVREQNLTKSQLEDYSQMSLLLSEMLVEASDLEKEEALFLAERAVGESVIARKITFKTTASGQRLIVLKRYISAVRTLLGSIKSRLYQIY
jgi:predicted metal-binding transcription factor (methanogenesis marker protein 9)